MTQSQTTTQPTTNDAACRSCGSTSRPIVEFGGGDPRNPRAGGTVRKCASCRAVWEAPVAEVTAQPVKVPSGADATDTPAPVVRLVPKTKQEGSIVEQISARLAVIDAELANHNALKTEARQLRRMLKAAKTQ